MVHLCSEKNLVGNLCNLISFEPSVWCDVFRDTFSSSVSSRSRSLLSDDLFTSTSSWDDFILSSGGFDAARRPKPKRCQRSNVYRRFSIIVGCYCTTE